MQCTRQTIVTLLEGLSVGAYENLEKVSETEIETSIRTNRPALLNTLYF